MIEGFDEIVLAWEKHELFYKELYEKKKGNPAGTCGGILQLQYVVFQQNGKAQYRV